MRRATTPTHIFNFPEGVSVSDLTEALITYSQCGNKILEKTLDNLIIDVEKNAISIDLTQAESDLFAPGKALVQVRCKINDTALNSQMIWIMVKPALNSEVL